MRRLLIDDVSAWLFWLPGLMMSSMTDYTIFASSACGRVSPGPEKLQSLPRRKMTGWSFTVGNLGSRLEQMKQPNKSTENSMQKNFIRMLGGMQFSSPGSQHRWAAV
jgi:hypothetical protein